MLHIIKTKTNDKMGKIDNQIIELSEIAMKEDLKYPKSIFCILVLRLMDTQEYGNNYCKALQLILEVFPEVDRKLLEKELDKYI